MGRRLITRGLAGAVALVVAASLAACSNDPGDEHDVVLPGDSPRPGAGPEPSLSPPPPELTPEEEAILAVYSEFRELEIELYADPDPALAREQMPAYLTAGLLIAVTAGVERLDFLAQVRVGRPAWSPTVVDLRLDDDPAPTATIQDCLDTTDWVLVEADSGEPVPPKDTIGVAADGIPAGRNVMTYEAVRDSSGEWLLEYAQFERGQEC